MSTSLFNDLARPGIDSKVISALFNGFGGKANFSQRESELLSGCLSRHVSCEAGHEFISSANALEHPKFILSGWMGRTKHLADGRRQIIDLYLPGDPTGFGLWIEASAQACYACLTQVRYADASTLTRRVAASPNLYPGLALALQQMEHEIQTRLIDQIMRTGRMLAHERMAHLALELYRRLDRVGLSVGNGFQMPLTQDQIADVLGMSTVHVNRTLQQLRRDRLLRTASGRWEILDMDRLAEMASGVRDTPS